MCNLVPVTSPDTGTVVVVEPARVARALRHPVRRAALATVLARDGAVSRESIAAAVRDGGAAFGATVGDGSRLRTALYHRHLPLLASADLVCLTGAGVAPGGHPLLDHSAVDPAGLCRDGADWDALGVVVGQPRRRTAVRLLTQATLPVALGPLARVPSGSATSRRVHRSSTTSRRAFTTSTCRSSTTPRWSRTTPLIGL